MWSIISWHCLTGWLTLTSCSVLPPSYLTTAHQPYMWTRQSTPTMLVTLVNGTQPTQPVHTLLGHEESMEQHPTSPQSFLYSMQPFRSQIRCANPWGSINHHCHHFPPPWDHHPFAFLEQLQPLFNLHSSMHPQWGKPALHDLLSCPQSYSHWQPPEPP